MYFREFYLDGKKSNFLLTQGGTVWLNIDSDSVAEENQLLERQHFHMINKDERTIHTSRKLLSVENGSVKISGKKKKPINDSYG